MRMAVEQGIHNLPWANPRPGAHVARAALVTLASENEAGHMCPISMTYSAAPVLRQHASLAMEWIPRLCSMQYDPSFCPPEQKLEKQGDSDLRANLTRAEPLGNGEFALDGHKWFCSAPMNDAFLVLAQAPAALPASSYPDGGRMGLSMRSICSG
jgi:putative acyl-CoA dehydrogenase